MTEFDALGFTIPSDCPPSQREYLLQTVTKQDEILRIKRTEQSWQKLIQEFNTGKLGSKELKTHICELRNSVIHYSIPQSVRPQVYLLLCGLTDAKVAIQNDLYLTLVSRFLDFPESSTLRRDIKMDLNRTFPEHKWFISKPEQATECLFRLLGAFALNQPHIGYCQSLNFVAAFFLVIFDHNELSAFVVLTFVVENILNGYYSRSLLRIMADMTVLDKLIEERIPKLHEHLKKNSVNISLVAPNWFMSGYTNCLPSITVAHLWDWVFLDRDISVLFRVAVGTMSLMEEKILDIQGTNELMLYIKQPCILEVLHNSKKLMALVHHNIKRVPYHTLQEMREQAYNEQRLEFDEYQTRKELILLPRCTHFCKEQLLKLKEKFNRIADDDGMITLEQMESLLNRMPNTKKNPELLQLLLRIFDKEENHLIGFTELAAGLSVVLRGTPTERLKMIFELHDIHGAGYLTRKEVAAAIRTIYKFFYETQEHPNVEEFVDVLFDNLDTNRTGKLSFDQFEGALLIEPKLARCFVPTMSMGTPQRRESMRNSTSGEENNQKLVSDSVLNLIPLLAEAKSRSDIISRMPSVADMSTSATASHAMIGSDSHSQCFCSLL